MIGSLCADPDFFRDRLGYLRTASLSRTGRRRRKRLARSMKPRTASPTISGYGIQVCGAGMSLLTLFTVLDHPASFLFAYLLCVQLIAFSFVVAFLMATVDFLRLCRLCGFLLSNRQRCNRCKAEQSKHEKKRLHMSLRANIITPGKSLGFKRLPESESCRARCPLGEIISDPALRQWRHWNLIVFPPANKAPVKP
jgi:hypothetical protein